MSFKGHSPSSVFYVKAIYRGLGEKMDFWLLFEKPIRGFRSKEAKEIPKNRPEEDREVDQRDPWLVFHVKLLEGEAPGMLDDDPAENVEDDADRNPNGPGDEGFY